MKKLVVQRKVEIWIEDTYEVSEINQDNIDDAINYSLDPINTEVLWESQEDLGLVEVFDNDYNLLLKNY